MDDLVRQGINALHVGDRVGARALLVEAVQAHPDDVEAWRWLADAVDSPVERRVCLEHLLKLHSDDTCVQSELEGMGPAPRPEPSPSQLVSAVKTTNSANLKRRIGQSYWRWLHAS